MNWRQREKMFQAAVEIILTSQCATVGGVAAKLNDLADYVDRGGDIGSGAMFVQSARRDGDTWRGWAIDFLSHLPDDRDERKMLVCHYCGTERYGKAVDWLSRKFWGRVPKAVSDQGKGIMGRM